jgi:hypothetical protein
MMHSGVHLGLLDLHGVFRLRHGLGSGDSFDVSFCAVLWFMSDNARAPTSGGQYH